jgi:predicted permease
MPVVPRVASLMRNLFHRAAVDRDLDQELRAYLELLTDEKIKAGLPPEAARRQARLELGGVEQVKEEVRQAQVGRLLETLLQDLRYGLRTLARTPAFTSVALLSLALGIGANAAMFSLVYGILIRPLPYPQPDRLVRVTGWYPRGAVVALQQQSRTLDAAAYTDDAPFNLTGQGEALRLTGSSVSASLFSLLGAHARLGRTFRPGEDRPGRDRLVLLSHALWESKFSADPSILGRFIAIDGIEREVVGVMPPEFAFPAASAQLWIPIHLDPTRPDEYWGAGWMPLVARLRPGATLARAQSELRPLIAAIIPLFPWPAARSWNADAAVVPLQQDLVGGVRGRLLVLLAAVGLVLLIACANVASLLLARAAARRKEVALRASLGAARGRIVRQLLTESILLALAGAAAGLVLAFSALAVLKTALPAGTPRLAEVSIDWRVLAFVVALAFLTGVAFGLAPALSASRLNLVEVIRGGGQRSSGVASVRLRGVLIAGEVALAVVLVVGAGLLIRTLWELSQVNPGFRPERIVTIRVSPSESSCRRPAACIALYDELLRRARLIHGVSQVAAANALPLGGQIPALPAELEDHRIVPGETTYPVLWGAAVTPSYFRILQIPVLKGRVFTEGDSEKSSPVVLVSAATARRFWPGRDPVGKHVRLAWDRDWRTVVGVVADVRQYDLANHSPSEFSGTLYMPYPQSVATAVATDRQLPATMTLLVRTASDPLRVGAEISRLVADLNPNVPVSGLGSMQALVSASAAPSRSMMWLFVAFAGSALVLAIIGTYGVVSYSAAQRTYEMGVRVALGASPVSLFTLVLGHSVRLVLAGLALGVTASLALTRMLARFLYGVTATDPLTFAAVALLLFLIALLAGYFPARRAASIDPLTALRQE